MGGNHETTINGLRFHENFGEVHIHDDANNLKFITNSKTLRENYNDMMQKFKKTDGIARIGGKTDTRLLIMKEDKNYTVFLVEEKKNYKKALDTFVGKL